MAISTTHEKAPGPGGSELSTLAKHHSSLCEQCLLQLVQTSLLRTDFPSSFLSLGTRRKRSAELRRKSSAPFHLHVISFWVAVPLVGPCLTTQCDLFKLQSSPYPWFLRGRVPGSLLVLKFMDAQVPQSCALFAQVLNPWIQPTMDRMAAFSIAGWLNPNTDGQLYTLAETT